MNNDTLWFFTSSLDTIKCLRSDIFLSQEKDNILFLGNEFPEELDRACEKLKEAEIWIRELERVVKIGYR